VYPLHKDYLKIFNDDVEHNEDGSERSRTAAIKPKQVNKIYGQADRLWS
jgi:hypothetical protein